MTTSPEMTETGRPTTSSPEAVAWMSDIVHECEHRTLLKAVALEVRAGEILGILGGSGSGKTLLLEILGGFVEPLVGDVLLRGEPVLKAAPVLIGYLPQTPAMDERLRVGHWLEYAAARMGLPPTLVEKSKPLERLHSLPLADTIIRDLSPGQKRLVDFATLLVQDAPLWLLDDPFAGLDDESADRLAACLTELRNENKGIVLTAARARDLSLADRVLKLDDGRLTEVTP